MVFHHIYEIIIIFIHYHHNIVYLDCIRNIIFLVYYHQIFYILIYFDLLFLHKFSKNCLFHLMNTIYLLLINLNSYLNLANYSIFRSLFTKFQITNVIIIFYCYHQYYPKLNYIKFFMKNIICFRFLK